LLGAHDTDDLLGGLLRHDGAPLDCLEQPPGAARRHLAQPERAIGVRLFIAVRALRERRVLREELAGRLRQLQRIGKPGLFEPGVDPADTAHFADCQIRGRVVARDHHLHQHIPDRRLQPRVVIPEDAGPATHVRGGDGDTLIERQRSLFRQLIREDQHGELDDARAVEGFVGANGRLFTRGEMFDPHAGARGNARHLRIQQPLQSRRRLCGRRREHGGR